MTELKDFDLETPEGCQKAFLGVFLNLIDGLAVLPPHLLDRLVETASTLIQLDQLRKGVDSTEWFLPSDGERLMQEIASDWRDIPLILLRLKLMGRKDEIIQEKIDSEDLYSSESIDYFLRNEWDTSHYKLDVNHQDSWWFMLIFCQVLDGENLAERGFIELVESFKPALQALGVTIPQISDEEFTANSYSVRVNGREHFLYTAETPEMKMWSSAVQAARKIFNEEILTRGYSFTVAADGERAVIENLGWGKKVPGCFYFSTDASGKLAICDPPYRS